MCEADRVDHYDVLARELGAHRRMAGCIAPYIRTLYTYSAVDQDGIHV